MSLKTKVKGQFNVEEVNALNQKYEGGLTRSHYMQYIGGPALLAATIGIMFTYYWFVALLLGLLGAWYGYRYILPSIIKQRYYVSSLKERNAFVNNMTQILTDKGKTIGTALGTATARAKGELKQDLKILQVSLAGSNEKQKAEAFTMMRNKYQHDVVFIQYLEQLETLAQEGNSDRLMEGNIKAQGGSALDTLKEIKSYHNDMLTQQRKFLELKTQKYGEIKQLLQILGIVLGSLTVSFGFKTYFGAFAHSPVGWITTLIYCTLLYFQLNKFRKLYFDDEIMFVSK